MTSILKVDSIQNSAGTVIMPVMAGGIIQTQFTQFTGTSVTACGADVYTIFSDLTVDITPTASNSIIMLTAMVNGEFSANQAHNVTWSFFRDSTRLGHPTSGARNVGIQMGANISLEANSDTTPEGAYYTFFDSPSSTSQITFKVCVRMGSSAANYNLNRNQSDADSISNERGTSFIMAQEIAQ